MKKSIIFITLILFFNQLEAQDITGNWYSTDSSRLYEIKRVSGKEYNVLIKSSSRKADYTGFVVIRDMEYNARKRRFEGFMYAPGDNTPVFVKIWFSKNNHNRILLKLSRMFFFDVTMNWTRV